MCRIELYYCHVEPTNFGVTSIGVNDDERYGI